MENEVHDNNPNNDPAQNDDGNEIDYKALYEQAKAESRKWEDRAKANKEKADKYDAAAGGEESLEARIAKLEADKQELEQQRERHMLVAKVAAETGLSEVIVATLNGSDEEALTEQAKAVAELMPKGAPHVPERGKFPRGKESKSTAEQFADLVDEALG